MLTVASGMGSIRVGAAGLLDSSGWLTITSLFDGIPLGAVGALLPPPVSWLTLETACLMASEVS